MKNTLKLTIVLVLVFVIGIALFVWQAKAQAHNTYYMCNSGCDFQNLQQAFSGAGHMLGGDTLIIKDGTYSGSSNQIWQFMTPPTGSEGNYTIIKAQNPGQVVFTGDASINIQGPGNGNMRYWQFEGIKWVNFVSLYAVDHIKFFHCAFEGDVVDGNTVAFGASNSHYILLEDCIAYGKGRYKFLVYQSSEVVLRRCVARQDYANGNWNPANGTEPIGAFSIYSSNNVECQNCVSIDGDKPQFWQNPPTEFGGSFYAPGGSNNVKWTGCISLNVAMEGSFDSSYGKDIIFNNCVFWHQVSGAGSKPGQGNYISHSTVGDLRPADEIGLSVSQLSGLDLPAGIGIGSHSEGFPAQNNIITGAFGTAINSVSQGGNVLWDNSNNGNILPSDITNINPFLDSLKYLPRIEAGSSLSGKALDGGDIGANITKKIGISGSLYGDAGYNQITNENLWPWPYEDWVKNEMGNYNRGGGNSSLPRGDRGFASYVSPFSSPNTLTSYIWEYLGNKIPNDIYGGTPAPQPTTCTSFTYSAWGACQSNNTQTRTIISQSPTGCTGGSPILSQSCVYTPPATSTKPIVNTCTSFTYSAWSSCKQNSTQTRRVIAKFPAGCKGGDPVLKQDCPVVSSPALPQEIGSSEGNSQPGTITQDQTVSSINVTPVESTTARQLQDQISQLIAKVSLLQAQLSQSQGGEIVDSSAIIPEDFTFQKNLKPGDKGIDVTYLQLFLMSQGTDVYPLDYATGYFGNSTKLAIVKFQEKYASEILIPNNLKNGNGLLRPSTRAKINSLLGD